MVVLDALRLHQPLHVPGTMTYVPSSAISPDGTVLPLTSRGSGPPLVLVHGGMRGAAAWAPLLPHLVDDHTVVTVDRRGRGASGDTAPYAIEREYEDVRAVVEQVAAVHGPPDVLGHSFGALCALGAVGLGAPIGRLVLAEPPGPATVTDSWLQRIAAWLDAGEVQRALVSFLVEVIGLDRDEVTAMRDDPRARDAVAIAAATMRREAHAIRAVDLDALARAASVPTLFLLGSRSPAWAGAVTDRLRARTAEGTLMILSGAGHDAVDEAADRVAAAVRAFLAAPGHVASS